MEVVNVKDKLTAHFHSDQKTHKGDSLLCMCPHMDLFAVASGNVVTLWSTTPLLLLSTLTMTRRITSLKWDEHSWRIIEVEYKDESRYSWLLLIDAEMHLQKHIKSVISNPTETKKKNVIHVNLLSGVNSSISSIVTLQDGHSVTVTPLLRLIPPSMSQRQSLVLCSAGDIHLILSKSGSKIIHVADTAIHQAILNHNQTLLAIVTREHLTLLKIVSDVVSLITRLSQEIAHLAWIGRDLLVTSSKDCLSFWVIQEEHGQVSEVHREALPNKILAMDSSHPDLLIIVMECPSDASSRVLVMRFTADGEQLVPELIAERRLARDVYNTTTTSASTVTLPVAIPNEDHQITLISRWQLDYHDGQILLMTPTKQLWHTRLNTPWQCLEVGVVKYFRMTDALVVVMEEGNVCIWDLRGAIHRVKNVNGNEDTKVMSSYKKENVWLFDRGLLYLCRVRDGNRLLEYPVNLISHWLSNASITSADIDCCSDFLLELVIANALSLDRVKANNNAQQELHLLYTLLQNKDTDGVLIRVLRKTEASLHSLLYNSFHTTSLELYSKCFEKGNLQDACLALVLLDPSDAMGRVEDLKTREGLDEETKEQLESFSQGLNSSQNESPISAGLGEGKDDSNEYGEAIE